MKSGDSFLIVVCHYFHQLGQHLFFSIRWEIFHSQCMILNISSKGYTIEFIANFSLRILIMSLPWHLFGLRILMVFAISSLVNEIAERRLFVLLNNSIGSLLIFSTSVHQRARRSHVISQLSEVHSGNHLLCLHKRTIGNFKEQLTLS